MAKSYGIEYCIIIAAITASLSVPVFANSILVATSGDTEPATEQSSTVKSLGTVSPQDVNNITQMKMPGNENRDAADQPFQPMETNGITYITGGIGDEERQELESTKQNYNLHITSAGTGGEYIGNTRIVIRDRNGNELVNVPSGPIFYAQLPADSYTIEARSAGRTQERHVTVGRSHSSLHFSWK